MLDNRIKVDIPSTIFVWKADERQDDEMVIYTQASNEHIDKDGEHVLQQALIQSSEYFLTEGVVSYDHLHKLERDPRYIIGEPLDVKFDEGNNNTFVKAKLYKEMEYARSIYNIIKSESTRVRSSIGGIVKNRRGQEILSVLWDELALTVKPIGNELTPSSITPLSVFVKSYVGGNSMQKGLMTPPDYIPCGIPDDATVLSTPIPREFQRSIFHVLTLILSGKLSTYGEIVDYLVTLGHNAIEQREIFICMRDLGSKVKNLMV